MNTAAHNHSVLTTNSNYKAKYNVYYAKLQCILHSTTGKLQIVLHKIAIVWHYTTLSYVCKFPCLTSTVASYGTDLIKLYI